MKSKIKHLVVLSCLILISTPSVAYNIYRQCGYGLTTLTWPSPLQTFTIRAPDFPSSHRIQIGLGALRFRQVPGSNLAFNTASNYNVNSFGYGNNRNEIYVDWTQTAPYAFARIAFSPNNPIPGSDFCDNSVNGSLIEGDVILSPITIPGTNQQSFSTNFADLENNNNPSHIMPVIMHELGHMAGSYGDNSTSTGGAMPGQTGSSHEDRFASTMNSFIPNGGYLGGRALSGFSGTTLELLADEGAMIRFLYPTGGDGRYDAAGSRFSTPTVGSGTIFRGNDDVLGSGNQIVRGQGYFMPYTIMNLSHEQQDVRVDFYMTQDGILDGNSADIQLEHNGSPVYHLFTMDALGTPPDNAYPDQNPSILEGSMYFTIPNNQNLIPDNSQWNFGFRVSMPSLPGGNTDSRPNNDWALYRRVYTVQ